MIITTAEYKTWINELSSDSDAIIDLLIPAVQDDLETACSRKFDSAIYIDEAYDGKGEAGLWLNNTPVSAISAVKLLSGDGSTTTLSTSEYRLNGKLGRLGRLGSATGGWGESSCEPVWAEGDGNVLVSYTAGYADTKAPAGLKMLMFHLVDAALDRRGENWTIASAADGVENRTKLNSAEYKAMKAALIKPYMRGGL